MERVPLTDTEKKNRARALTYSKALKLFNGGFAFDASTQKLIDDAIAKYNPTPPTITPPPENVISDDPPPPPPSNDPPPPSSGYDRSVRNPTLDQEGNSFAKEAETEGFGTSELDALEYQMMVNGTQRAMGKKIVLPIIF